MTRPDYIVDLVRPLLPSSALSLLPLRSTDRLDALQDSWHVINVDRYHNVRPDSRLMLSAFKAVAAEKDFQEKVRLAVLFLSLPLARLQQT